MTDNDPAPTPEPEPPKFPYRRTLFYCETEADGATWLAALGFGAPVGLAGLSAGQQARVLNAVQLGLTLASIQELANVPYGCFANRDGRIAVICPTEPRTVVIESGPAVESTSLMPHSSIILPPSRAQRRHPGPDPHLN
jgi:hypothetical protein